MMSQLLTSFSDFNNRLNKIEKSTEMMSQQLTGTNQGLVATNQRLDITNQRLDNLVIVNGNYLLISFYRLNCFIIGFQQGQVMSFGLRSSVPSPGLSTPSSRWSLCTNLTLSSLPLWQIFRTWLRDCSVLSKALSSSSQSYEETEPLMPATAALTQLEKLKTL
jgi:hypothetical protein